MRGSSILSNVFAQRALCCVECVREFCFFCLIPFRHICLSVVHRIWQRPAAVRTLKISFKSHIYDSKFKNSISHCPSFCFFFFFRFRSWLFHLDSHIPYTFHWASAPPSRDRYTKYDTAMCVCASHRVVSMVIERLYWAKHENDFPIAWAATAVHVPGISLRARCWSWYPTHISIETCSHYTELQLNDFPKACCALGATVAVRSKTNKIFVRKTECEPPSDQCDDCTFRIY